MPVDVGNNVVTLDKSSSSRVADKMLSKILQKLPRLTTHNEQEHPVDGDDVEAENTPGNLATLEDINKMTPDTIESSEDSKDCKDELPTVVPASTLEHVMDHNKAPYDGRRSAEIRNFEHPYANGSIHEHITLNQGTHFDIQRKYHNSGDTRQGEHSIIPKITTSTEDSDQKPVDPPSYNEFSRLKTRHSDTESSFIVRHDHNESSSSSPSAHLKLNSTAVLDINDVSSDLKCSMCLRQYSDPRFLPCLHSFCYRCLEEEVEHRTEMRIRCATCQRDYDLGRFHSAKGLPTNFVVTTLIDKAALDRFEIEPISCSSCEEKLPATVRCTDCMDYLCSTCHIAHHRLRLTKGHQILALHDIRRSKNVADLLHRPMYCSQHSHEKIRFYCKSCEQAICRECTMGDHSSREHRYFTVSEAIESERSFIEKRVEKVRNREPLLRQAMQKVRDVECKLESKAKIAKSEINKCYPRLIQALQERHKFLLNEVDKMYHGKSKVLHLQQRKLETDLDNLLTTCKVSGEVLEHGNDTEVLVMKTLLSNRLEEMNTTKILHDPEENDVIYFSAQEETMLKAIQTLGSVKVSSAYAALSCVVGGLKRVPHGKRSSFTVNTRDHYGAQCNEGGERLQANIQTSNGDYTSAEVTDNKDGSYTVSFCPTQLGSHRVSVCIQNDHVQGSPFTVQVVQSGGMILKFGRKGSNVGEFNGIFGVAVDPTDGRIVVTDCHNHRVQVFSSDGQFLFNFGRKGEGSGEFQCPTGVAINVRGQIIICERLSYRLQVFSRDGSFLREYRIPDLKASTLAVGEADQIVIADSANRCVHVVNMETGHSIKFGSFGDESGELSYPCYVTVNQRGRIIVSDMHSHKIQVFDSRGQFMFNFGKKGSSDGELLRPTGVAVSREGHIIVADRDNHRVQIFSTEGKFLHKFGSKGDGDGQLNDPHGLSITKDGSIVVADFRNNRVQVFGRVG